MSYQVLARKYRPLRFTEVVGQEHVTKTLTNAILRDRIHHAYLFTGVRGTGKTSLARLFAMALNCEGGPKVDFDPNSSNCQAIQKGQFLDVLEIDGASNTSVDSVRELREQIKYFPAAGKYKVYIIDEVHMLSTSAFNALLKTLEEPPKHVVFLFATTEAHKIPITILSRCQRFDLRRLTQSQLIKQLQWICGQEKIKASSASLEILARAAEGSMRDAQSLLDTAIGMTEGALEAATVQSMLGWVSGPILEQLTESCLQGNLSVALKQVQEIYEVGYDLRQIMTQWVDYFHDLILLKTAGREALSTEWTHEQEAQMQKIIQPIALADLQLAFQQIYQGVDQIFRSDSPKILLDLLLVKLVHGAPFQSLGSVLAGKSETVSSPVMSIKPINHSAPLQETILKTEAPIPSSVVSSFSSTSPHIFKTDIKEILEKILGKQPQIKAILEHAHFLKLEDEKLHVAFDKGSLWVDMFQEKSKLVAELLSEELAKPIQVLVHEQKLEKSNHSSQETENTVLPEDPILKEAIQVFNAKVKEVRKL